jgi:hypothetical protein
MYKKISKTSGKTADWMPYFMSNQDIRNQFEIEIALK